MPSLHRFGLYFTTPHLDAIALDGTQVPLKFISQFFVFASVAVENLYGFRWL